VAANAGAAAPRESLGMQFFNWILGCVLIYTTLFGIGKLIFKEWPAGAACIVVAVIAGALISRNLSQTDWEESPVAE
jgi:hypothetical protein